MEDEEGIGGLVEERGELCGGLIVMSCEQVKGLIEASGLFAGVDEGDIEIGGPTSGKILESLGEGVLIAKVSQQGLGEGTEGG